MGIEEVTVSAPSHNKTIRTCKKCSKRVKVHVACFKCRNIYHAKCFLKVPRIHFNEKGQIFCCQNLTSKYNSFESKLQIQENKNGKCIEEGVCGSDDGSKNSTHEQEEHEEDEPIRDKGSKKREILKEVNRGKVGFVCSFCEVKYFEEKSYRRHIKLCEKNHLRVNKTQSADENFKKEYKCDKCSYMSKHRWLLKMHLNIHSCVKPLKCTFRSCTCTRSSDSSQAKLCDCSVCEYRTASKVNLRRHILRNHSNKQIIYKCASCTYSTPLKNRLTEHVQVHLSKKPFKCDTCKFETIYKRSLSMHMQFIHGKVEKKYKCNDCEYSTHRKNSLRGHVSIHSNKKQLKCGECEYATTFKSQLINHISSMHSIEGKRHTCAICGFVTVFKSNFRRHIYAHGKTKQFQCHNCEYFTHRMDNLRKHMDVHINKSV